MWTRWARPGEIRGPVSQINRGANALGRSHQTEPQADARRSRHGAKRHRNKRRNDNGGNGNIDAERDGALLVEQTNLLDPKPRRCPLAYH